MSYRESNTQGPALTLPRCLALTSLSVGLALAACSSDAPIPIASGGSAGTPTSGNAGVPAAGGGGSANATAGAGGMAGGSAGAAGSSAGTASGGGGATSGGGGATSGGGGVGEETFVLTSPAFEHVEACSKDNKDPCQLFPSTNVLMGIGGMNRSPELNWSAAPAGTMSFVMCLHDTSNGNTHWCLWSIPAETRQLAAGLARQKTLTMPAGAVQDSFSTTDDGYQGPGAKGNVYQFRLFALSLRNYTPPNAENRESVYDELEADPDGIVIGTATLRGRSNPN